MTLHKGNSFQSIYDSRFCGSPQRVGSKFHLIRGQVSISNNFFWRGEQVLQNELISDSVQYDLNDIVMLLGKPVLLLYFIVIYCVIQK